MVASLFMAGICSAWALILALVRGPAVFEAEIGVGLPAVIAVYFGGFLAAGLVVATCLTSIGSRASAAVLGYVAALPLSMLLAASVGPRDDPLGLVVVTLATAVLGAFIGAKIYRETRADAGILDRDRRQGRSSRVSQVSPDAQSRSPRCSSDSSS